MNTVLNLDRKQLAKLFKGVGVEVGVAGGNYSKVILDNPKVAALYGVDPYEVHEGYRDYARKETFNKMYNTTVELLHDYPNFSLIKKYSMEAVGDFEDNSLDFVYIDADHSYRTVMEDIVEWTKKVKPRGIVAGDDYFEAEGREGRYDVIRAVDDYVKAYHIPELFIYGRRNPPNWMFIRP